MNRKLHNTFSALSVAAVLMTAGLIASSPARQAESAPQLLAAISTRPAPQAGVAPQPWTQHRLVYAERSAQARKAAAEMRAKDIEARADALANKLRGTRDVGEILSHVAGFTAEVATESALDAAADELANYDVSTVETIEAPAPSPAAPKIRHSRRSITLPYFSFAPRG
ncbi:hypothetical protein FCE95_02320 [Luteimonas gilva]|uniref:Inhibitor I9 domain-containing protein n=1 Tax=Luteimonas gilva TaxID=2572684 RepID=A0A4U5JVR4_9GAMM|nr:hypothetical protein [Luteimonas gilva]TKR33166.1 hypothetical protein FCE95_02320 [Luteimonas gilva]